MAVAPDIPRDPHELLAELLIAATLGAILACLTYFLTKAWHRPIARKIDKITPESVHPVGYPL